MLGTRRKISDVLEDVDDHGARIADAIQASSAALAETVDKTSAETLAMMADIRALVSSVRATTHDIRAAADAHRQAMTTVNDILTSIVIGTALAALVVYGHQ